MGGVSSMLTRFCKIDKERVKEFTRDTRGEGLMDGVGFVLESGSKRAGFLKLRERRETDHQQERSNGGDFARVSNL